MPLRRVSSSFLRLFVKNSLVCILFCILPEVNILIYKKFNQQGVSHENTFPQCLSR